MKAIKFLYIAATALLFAACANEDDGMGNRPVAATVRADIFNSVNTRATVNNTWTANEDAIGVYVTSTGYTKGDNVKYVVSDQAGNFTPADNPIYFADKDETSFSAYYPYCSSNDTRVNQDGTINWQGGVVKDGKCQWDFLFAHGATARQSSPIVHFSGNNAFKHCMAMVQFIIKAGDFVTPNETLLNGDFILDGVNNEGIVNPKTGEAIANATTKTKLSEPMNQSLADDITISFILLPQSLQSDSLSVSLKVSANGTTNTCSTPLTLPADGKFNGGNMYTYTLFVSNTKIEIENSSIIQWGKRDFGDLDVDVEP